MPRAKSSWVALQRSSANTGTIRPRHWGATPVTGLPGWPKIMLATWVPWLDMAPSALAPSATRVGKTVRLAPSKQGWFRSTGPSRTAIQISGWPRSSGPKPKPATPAGNTEGTKQSRLLAIEKRQCLQQHQHRTCSDRLSLTAASQNPQITPDHNPDQIQAVPGLSAIINSKVVRMYYPRPLAWNRRA